MTDAPTFAVPLRGVDVDAETRCAHYHTEHDVVAMRFGCCATYYPCHACHDALANHDPEPWPRERFDEPAVLCGVCRSELTAHEYLDADHECPACGTAFNPGCARHAHLYFEGE